MSYLRIISLENMSFVAVVVALMSPVAYAGEFTAEISCFREVSKFYHCFSNGQEGCDFDVAALAEKGLAVFHRNGSDGRPQVLVYTQTEAYEQTFPSSVTSDEERPYAEAHFQFKPQPSRAPASDRPLFFTYGLIHPERDSSRKPAQVDWKEGFVGTDPSEGGSYESHQNIPVGDRIVAFEKAREYMANELIRRIRWAKQDFGSWDKPTRNAMRRKFPAMKAALSQCEKVQNREVRAATRTVLAWLNQRI